MTRRARKTVASSSTCCENSTSSKIIYPLSFKNLLTLLISATQLESSVADIYRGVQCCESMYIEEQKGTQKLGFKPRGKVHKELTAFMFNGGNIVPTKLPDAKSLDTKNIYFNAENMRKIWEEAVSKNPSVMSNYQLKPGKYAEYHMMCKNPKCMLSTTTGIDSENSTNGVNNETHSHLRGDSKKVLLGSVDVKIHNIGIENEEEDVTDPYYGCVEHVQYYIPNDLTIDSIQPSADVPLKENSTSKKNSESSNTLNPSVNALDSKKHTAINFDTPSNALTLVPNGKSVISARVFSKTFAKTCEGILDESRGALYTTTQLGLAFMVLMMSCCYYCCRFGFWIEKINEPGEYIRAVGHFAEEVTADNTPPAVINLPLVTDARGVVNL